MPDAATELDWKEALESAIKSHRANDLGEWELHLIGRRVESLLPLGYAPFSLSECTYSAAMFFHMPPTIRADTMTERDRELLAKIEARLATPEPSLGRIWDDAEIRPLAALARKTGGERGGVIEECAKLLDPKHGEGYSADVKRFMALLAERIRALKSTPQPQGDVVTEAHELVAFVATWAVQYQIDYGLDGLHPTHYDLLKKYGARMDSFKRANALSPHPTGAE